MQTMLSLLSGLCESSSMLGCAYLAVAIFSVWRFSRRRDPESAHQAPVSLLKPLHGDEPGLLARLLGNFEQSYEGGIQMVCGVREDADLAATRVRQMQQSGNESIRLIVDSRQHGSNKKVSNLANMLHLAENELLVISDSDIEVGPNYLGRVVSHLHRSNVGAVTCLYHGVPASGMWARYAALAINSHFLPSMIVAVTFDLDQPCCGSTIAIRKQTLQALGGFERFAEHLADDYEIGKAVRSAGYDVAIPTFTVAHHCFSDSLRSLLTQELRAARTVRCINSIGYAGSFITHPFPLALGALLAGGENVALIGCSLFLRALLCVAVERTFRLPRQPYMLLPFRELLSFLVFFLSFCGTRVNWRGMDFNVTASGVLEPAKWRERQEQGQS